MVGNRVALDQRIWQVTYGRVTENATLPVTIDLAAARRRLIVALTDIHAFSVRKQCDPFSECFRKALDALTTPTRSGYHNDLSPANLLPAEAEAVLDACQSAWVFGGMGSWNDMGFDGQDGREYDRVSQGLFAALTYAIAEAATSSIRV